MVGRLLKIRKKVKEVFFSVLQGLRKNPKRLSETEKLVVSKLNEQKWPHGEKLPMLKYLARRFGVSLKTVERTKNYKPKKNDKKKTMEEAFAALKISKADERTVVQVSMDMATEGCRSVRHTLRAKHDIRIGRETFRKLRGTFSVRRIRRHAKGVCVFVQGGRGGVVLVLFLESFIFCLFFC